MRINGIIKTQLWRAFGLFEMLLARMLNAAKLVVSTIAAVTGIAIASAILMIPTAVQFVSALSAISITPNSGPMTGGDQVTIKGSGFMKKDKIVQFKSANNASFALTNLGDMYGWGQNSEYSDGALGLGDSVNRNIPTKISFPGLTGKIVAFDTSGLRTVAISDKGEVYTWGNNSKGQLGLGNNNATINVPTKLSYKFDNSIAKVWMTGYGTTFVMTSDGDMYAWGYNAEGQTTQSPTESAQTTPTIVDKSKFDGQVIEVDSMYDTVFAITDKGSLYSWGGKTVRPDRLDVKNIPTIINSSSFDGTVQMVDGWYISSNSGYNAIMLTDAGSVWIFGQSGFKKLDMNGVDGKIVSLLSNGANHFFIKTAAGTYYAYGDNNFGELGLGDKNDRTIPSKLPLDNIGSGIAEISPGYDQTLLLSNDGDLYSAGDNSMGALGQGNNDDLSTFTRIKSMPPLTPNIKSVTFGNTPANNFIVQDDSTITATVPASTTAGTVDVTVADNDGNVVKTTSYTYLNPMSLTGITPNNGSVAGGNSVTISGANMLRGKGIKKIVAGSGHTLALITDGKLYAWGNNNYGQLGFGDTTNRTTPTALPTTDFDGTVISVATGLSYTIALTDNGSVYGWGYNSNGQLGQNDATNRSAPVKIQQSYFGGDKVTSIAAGRGRIFAITSAGKLYAWGNNNYGQLGLGDQASRSIPTEVSRSNFGNKNISAIVVGGNQTIALTADNKLYAWGSNTYGELGTGDNTARNIPTLVNISSLNGSIKALAAGDSYSMVLTTAGKIYAWGNNGYGQLGLNDTNNRNIPTEVATTNMDGTVAAISAGGSHALALTTTHKLYTWGNNNYGQLGFGDTTSRKVPTEVPTSGFSGAVISLAAGDTHTLVLVSPGKLYAWGNNDNGQLGFGDGANASYSTPAETTFFTPVSIVKAVKFGDVEVPSTDYTVTNDSTIVVDKVPTAQQPGRVDVTVIDNDGVAQTLPQAYLYTELGLNVDQKVLNLAMDSDGIGEASQTLAYDAVTANGYNISLSTEGAETGLVGKANTSNKIATSDTKPVAGLNKATWGYSLDGGSKFKPLQPIASPDVLKRSTASETEDVGQTLNVTFGTAVTATTPADTYSQTVIYTITAEP